MAPQKPPFKSFYIRGLWDCGWCGGHKGLDARFIKHCPGCGGQFQHKWQYPDPTETPISDRGELVQAMGGPNWTCEHCSADNFESALCCIDCGAPKDGSQPRQVRQMPETLPRDSQEAEELSQSWENPPVAPPPLPAVSSWQPQRHPSQTFDLVEMAYRFRVPLVIAGAIAGIWLIWAVFFNTHPVQVHVDHPHWVVTQNTRDYGPVNGSGFFKPPDATQDYVDSEISGYGEKRGDDLVESVATEEYQVTGWGKCTTDQGNNTYKVEPCATQEWVITGYGEKRTPRYTQVPTMSPHYHYHTMEWYTGTPAVNRGDNWEPIAPVVVATSTHEPSGAPVYEWYIYFVDKSGKVYSNPIAYTSETSWRSIKEGIWYEGQVNSLGMLMSVSPAK